VHGKKKIQGRFDVETSSWFPHALTLDRTLIGTSMEVSHVDTTLETYKCLQLIERTTLPLLISYLITYQVKTEQNHFVRNHL